MVAETICGSQNVSGRRLKRSLESGRDSGSLHRGLLASKRRGMNRLYFGDNLLWLRNTKEFPDACVDLVYLDRPFIARPYALALIRRG